MKVLIPLIFFFIVSSVNAQIVNPNSNYAKPKPLPKKTSVEIQAIQTRTFETSEKKLFRATLKVLQNNRYKDIISDFDGGIITAKLPPVDASDTAGEKVGKAIGRFFLGPLIPGEKIGHIERNINITFDPIKESLVEIRVAFQMYEITKELNTLFSNNETIESDLTDQPEVYQAFFEEIDKELFVRKNKY